MRNDMTQAARPASAPQGLLRSYVKQQQEAAAQAALRSSGAVTGSQPSGANPQSTSPAAESAMTPQGVLASYAATRAAAQEAQRVGVTAQAGRGGSTVLIRPQSAGASLQGSRMAAEGGAMPQGVLAGYAAMRAAAMEMQRRESTAENASVGAQD